MRRYYLPDTSVFNRYDPRIQNNLINGYHQRMTVKYDYFVRFQLNNERPFYTNSTLDEVATELDNIEVINCNWIAEKWNTVPWQYYITIGDIYEEYQGENSYLFSHGYNGPPIGNRKDNEWYFKYFEGKNCTYWRDRNSKESTWHLRYGNQYVNLHNDSFSVGIFGHTKDTKDAPVDLIIPLLRQMNTKKWNGFYDDEIEFILEQTGIERRLM